MNQEILRGMALAFFASAYAEQADECGQPLRGEIMDQLPEHIDPAAEHAARTLYFDMERVHDMKIEDLYHQHSGDLSMADWGHYAAMEAMGHGVGLFIYDIDIKVPYVEFGSHSLTHDYFTSEEE